MALPLRERGRRYDFAWLEEGAHFYVCGDANAMAPDVHEALIQTIRQGKLSHDGNQTMRQHLLNACWYTNRFGLYFKKDDPESPNKVDAYAALLLAFI